MRTFPFLLALAATPLVAGVARADAPHAAAPAVGSDIIHLKNGGMLRGTLVEVIPDDHATVQLATGQSARVDWPQIARIERGVTGPTAAPPPPPSAAPVVVATAPAQAQTVVVHIESEDQVRLEMKGAGRTWTEVCSSPCDRAVDLSQTYRINGSGIRASSTFTLHGQPNDRVVLNVNTSSTGGFVGGIILVSVGPVVSLVGLVVLLVSSISLDGSGGSSSGKAVGTALAVGGLGGLVLGIVLIASNARSGVDQNIAQPVAPAAPPPRAAWFDGIREPAGLPTPVLVTSPAIRF